MGKIIKLLALCVCNLVLASPVLAEVILESEPLITNPNGGYVVADSVYIGARFTLDEPRLITSIGGQVYGRQYDDRTLFAAVVPLAGSDLLPDNEIENTALLIKVFTAPLETNSLAQVKIPTNLILDAGDYGLVFGSGLFGATGSGWVTTPKYGAYENRSWFLAYDNGWMTPGTTQTTRFVIEGTDVREYPVTSCHGVC